MTYIFISIIAMNVIGFQWGVWASLNAERKIEKMFTKTLNQSQKLRHANGRVIRLTFSKSAKA